MADRAVMFNFSEKPEMQDRPDMRPRVTASFSSSSAGSLDPGPPVPRGVNDDNGSDEEEVQGEVFPTAAVAPEVDFKADQESAGPPGEVAASAEVPDSEEAVAGQGAATMQEPLMCDALKLPVNTEKTAIPNLRTYVSHYGGELADGWAARQDPNKNNPRDWAYYAPEGFVTASGRSAPPSGYRGRTQVAKAMGLDVPVQRRCRKKQAAAQPEEAQAPASAAKQQQRRAAKRKAPAGSITDEEAKVLQTLRTYVKALGSPPGTLEDGWRVEQRISKGERTQGMPHNYFWPPEGFVPASGICARSYYVSMKAVAEALGLPAEPCAGQPAEPAAGDEPQESAPRQISRKKRSRTMPGDAAPAPAVPAAACSSGAGVEQEAPAGSGVGCMEEAATQPAPQALPAPGDAGFVCDGDDKAAAAELAACKQSLAAAEQRKAQLHGERDEAEAQLREKRCEIARLKAAASCGAAAAAAEAAGPGQNLQDMDTVLKAVGLAQKNEAVKRLLQGVLGNENMPTLLKVFGLAHGNAGIKQLLLGHLGAAAAGQ